MSVDNNNRDDGGPAFPLSFPVDLDELSMNDPIKHLVNQLDSWQGMTLRDWFAGQALQGILSNPNSGDCTFREYCNEALTYADAMLEERKKGASDE
jgi:hypothetical protein